MRITKRHLKRIIREEYSKLKRSGLLREMHEGIPHDELDDPEYAAMNDFDSGNYGASIPDWADEEWKEAYYAEYSSIENNAIDREIERRSGGRRPSYGSGGGDYYNPSWGDSKKDYLD